MKEEIEKGVVKFSGKHKQLHIYFNTVLEIKKEATKDTEAVC